jgi:hypothetical protein
MAMPEILEDRSSHATVLKDDGSVEIISWGSEINRLIYRHDLAGLVKHGDEILSVETDEGTMQLIPNDDASEFSIEIGSESFSVPKHQKSALLSALDDAYGDDGLDDQVLLEFVYDLMDTTVNPAAAAQFLALPVFDGAVERTDKGWRIHDDVLLTYNNEFYQPETRRTKRTGEIVEGGSNKVAYELKFSQSHDDTGQLDLTDFDTDYLGDDAELVEFLARAIWAVTYVPE